MKTRKQNLQANSRSACPFWHKRGKEAHSGCSRSCIYPLSTSGDWNDIIFALRIMISEMWASLQNCHIWDETWPSANIPEAAHTLFLPQGFEIELIFALWAAVSEIQTDFQIAIFGHETWSFTISKIRPFFKICHILAWHLAICKSSRSYTHMYTLFLWKGVETGLIFAVWAVVFDPQADCQNCHKICMKLGHCQKFQKLHIYSLSTPVGQNWAYFLPPLTTGNG